MIESRFASLLAAPAYSVLPYPMKGADRMGGSFGNGHGAARKPGCSLLRRSLQTNWLAGRRTAGIRYMWLDEKGHRYVGQVMF